MYAIFVIFSLIASAPNFVDVGVGTSKQSFDTLEACNAAIPALVAAANEQLADQGVKIRTATCLTADEIAKKTQELQGEQEEPQK